MNSNATQYICYCYRISMNDLDHLLKKYKCRSLNEIQMYCNAGKGCQTCISDIVRIIQHFSKTNE